LVPPPTDFMWPRLASVALATAITAAAMTNVLVTAGLTAASVALLVFDAQRPEPHAGHLSSTTLGQVATALGILAIAPAMAYVSRLWISLCAEIDAAANASREREAQALAAERASAARAAVDRRIHETVLNTLASISRAAIAPAAAQAQCASDLRELDSLRGGAPRSVQDMLALLLDKHPVPGPVLGVVHSDVVFRDDDAAQVAFDAMGEVLRNVTRHARATRTHIRAAARSSTVTFTVADDGVGMDESTKARFGLRRALVDSISSMGGQVLVTSAPGRGTQVDITMPLASPRSMPPAREAALDVLLGPVGARLAMLPALALGLVLLIPTSLTFSPALPVAVSYLAFAAVVIVVTVRWKARRTAVFAALALVFLITTQAAAWWGQQGCTSSSGIHLVVFATVGAMVIPALSIGRLRITWLLMVAISIPTLALPWVLPVECRPEALIPAVETTTWVAALVGIIAVLSRAVDRSDRGLDLRWRDVTLAEARRQALQAADERWTSVNAETRELLSIVANGSVSPLDPQVRASATRLESRLRSLLETSRIPQDGMRAFLDDVIERIASAGQTVSVTVIDSDAAVPPPPEVYDTLVAVSEHPGTRGMSLTLLDHELLVTADRHALTACGCRDLGETEDPDTAVAVLTWAGDSD
ncbi:MAG: ATP-binding protein, partial [Actinomycetota bacterium]